MDQVFKALSDPTRRRILQLLRQREMSAGELSEHFELAKATLSGHFAVLRAADLVASEKTGTTITYRLNVSVLEEALLDFAEALGSVRAASGVQRSYGRRPLASRFVPMVTALNLKFRTLVLVLFRVVDGKTHIPDDAWIPRTPSFMDAPSCRKGAI